MPVANALAYTVPMCVCVCVHVCVCVCVHVLAEVRRNVGRINEVRLGWFFSEVFNAACPVAALQKT